MSEGDPVRVLSWNVNGIRAVQRKGFDRWLKRSKATIVGVQETRAEAEQYPAPLLRLRAWQLDTVSAEKKGYSGVALFSRREPDRVETSLGESRFDREGRLQIAHYGKLVVINGYFPNGSGPNRDHSRVPYKLEFTSAVKAKADALRKRGRRVLVMGDFNTAHKEIDLARPKTNRKTSGFLDEERAAIDAWVDDGWLDSFRAFEAGPDHYTWWSQRFGVRERNVGWRIDMILASPNLRPFMRRAFHQPKVQGSDHCPVGLDLDPAVFD
jgi:exodeoxyribonuclease-3